jgi:hypothetical protein
MKLEVFLYIHPRDELVYPYKKKENNKMWVLILVNIIGGSLTYLENSLLETMNNRTPFHLQILLILVPVKEGDIENNLMDRD